MLILAFETSAKAVSVALLRDGLLLGQYLQNCGIAPQETLMIGDTLHDADVAKAIGAKCVLVARGHQSRQTLLTAGVPVVGTLTEAAQIALKA